MRARELLFNILLLCSGILIVVLIWYLSPPKAKDKPAIQQVTQNEFESTSIYEEGKVRPIIFTKLPDLKDINAIERKSVFIKTMLPSILLVERKYDSLRHWVEKMKDLPTLAERDSLALEELKKKFKAKDVEELALRLHTHPVSISLAQAAIESGWGISRFCREGNNVFGIWSFSSSDQRMEAGETREGKRIYVKKYNSVLESIDDYYLNLARSFAFDRFRKKRAESDNPFELIWFLGHYSEKRFDYIVMLRNIMDKNALSKYDDITLQDFNVNDETWLALLDL